ncbi:MAG: cryptochrome/photolyase family protein [Lacibacter sp.]
MKQEVAICWLRRDLRLHDHTALYHALNSGLSVVPVFIFDTAILDQLDDPEDRRVAFIHQTVSSLKLDLQQHGADIEVYYGRPLEVFSELNDKYKIGALYFNHDFEPYALSRDAAILHLFTSLNIPVYSYKDHVVFEKNEVVKDDGSAYQVFTPYSKKWKQKLNDAALKDYNLKDRFSCFFKQHPVSMPKLEEMGFVSKPFEFPGWHMDELLIRRYKEQRDFPALNGTSKLSVHLRFGTISIRGLVRSSLSLNETFLNELIWRDFYHMILWQFPHIGEGKSFKKEYDWIGWRNDEDAFHKWCVGQTGYPIVDAGMRELNATGFMHNRVRMITASFLCKHLLIDWRWGEAYFAKKLLDYDLAANNGGWQWAAGSGCDAAPYFRIFNPYLQTQRFDSRNEYIQKWVPEFQSLAYPMPIVEHDYARKRCLEVYSAVLKPSN